MDWKRKGERRKMAQRKCFHLPFPFYVVGERRGSLGKSEQICCPKLEGSKRENIESKRESSTWKSIRTWWQVSFALLFPSKQTSKGRDTRTESVNESSKIHVDEKRNPTSLLHFHPSLPTFRLNYIHSSSSLTPHSFLASLASLFIISNHSSKTSILPHSPPLWRLLPLLCSSHLF